jgi:flagellar biosynthesis protein FliQ
MTEMMAVDLIRQALLVAMWICLPMLLAMFGIGIVISLVQTLTSIQDPSVGAVPRLAAALLTFLVVVPWMFTKFLSYAGPLISNLSKYAR